MGLQIFHTEDSASLTSDEGIFCKHFLPPPSYDPPQMILHTTLQMGIQTKGLMVGGDEPCCLF